MKNILTIMAIALSLNAFGQQRTIIFQNDTLKIINDLYLNQPYTNEAGITRPHTSFFYVLSDRNEPDTLFRIKATVLEKPYFDGKHFTLLIQGMWGAYSYTLYELQNRKWKSIANVPAFSMTGTKRCEVKQPSMYVFNVDWYESNTNTLLKQFEYHFDMEQRLLRRFDIENGTLIKNGELPFTDYTKDYKF